MSSALLLCPFFQPDFSVYPCKCIFCSFSIEKIGTWSIGTLIALLALATLGSAIASLVTHDEPTTSPASLIISASALVIMILLWLPKRYLARALDSSTMAGEAACSLSCIQITLVVFVGALVFKLSRRAWWVDSAACIVLSILFAREAWKMLRWVSNPEFNGGCCGGCSHPKPQSVEKGEAAKARDVDEEKAEDYFDLCECCFTNDACRESDVCMCSTPSTSTLVSVSPSALTPQRCVLWAKLQRKESCCVPVGPEGTKCCSRERKRGPIPRFVSCLASQPGISSSVAIWKMNRKSKDEFHIPGKQLPKRHCCSPNLFSSETLRGDECCGTKEHYCVGDNLAKDVKEAEIEAPPIVEEARQPEQPSCCGNGCCK